MADVSFKKTPNFPIVALGSSGVGSFGPGGYGVGDNSRDFARLSPQIRNPLLNITNFYLPQDRKVLNQWIRYYDRFHPLVGNSLDLHAETVVSPFDLEGVEDEKVMQLYRDMTFDELDLFNKSVEIIREFYLIGEAFPFLQWNSEKGIFDQLVVMDPDYVHIHPHPFVHIKDAATFEIEPSEVLKEFVNSTDEVDMKLQKYLDPAVKSAIASGRMIRVSSFNLTAMLKRASPYDIRGTSIVLRCLKDLFYEDKLREAQYAIADGHVAPRWVFKLGDQQKGLPPRKEDLVEFRKRLLEGWYDYNFAIISSYALQIEAIGSAGKILPIVPEFQFVEDRILTALFTSKAATHGEGPTYANASVARLMANARYQNRRSMMDNFYKLKIFTPVARAHQFYKKLTPAEQAHGVRPDPKKRELLLPDVNWLNKLDLTDTVDFRNYLSKMRENLQVSMHTVCRIFGLDFKKEEKYLLEERGTVFDPIYTKYREKHMETIFEKQEGIAEPGEGGEPGAGPGGAAASSPGEGPGGGGEAPTAPEGTPPAPAAPPQ